MRIAVILLACVTALASAQYQDADGGLPLKALPIPIRSARFQRLPPSNRPIGSTQSVFANQRIRRPISFKPKGEDGLGVGGFSPAKPRLGLHTGPASPIFSQQVKPVNEEPEEEEKARDRDNQDDDFSLERSQEESQEDSDENVSRAIANLGAVGSPGPSSRPNVNHGGLVSTQPSPIPIQYRPFQGAPLSSGRGGSATPTPQPPPPPPPIQYRPSPKPSKARKPIEENFKQQVKAPPKPVKSPQIYDSRGKKPVAQIIRRYRNDNPDGSITWGFENDDGSYKEEIIGIDCITRGKYGYIDPDGIRREYTYETGIKCDEEQREEDEENGFVDYQENKLVLPDGKTIDLSSMGKKQARRPRPIYGN